MVGHLALERRLQHPPGERGPQAALTRQLQPAGPGLGHRLPDQFPIQYIRPGNGAGLGHLSAVGTANGPAERAAVEYLAVYGEIRARRAVADEKADQAKRIGGSISSLDALPPRPRRSASPRNRQRADSIDGLRPAWTERSPTGQGDAPHPPHP